MYSSNEENAAEETGLDKNLEKSGQKVLNKQKSRKMTKIPQFMKSESFYSKITTYKPDGSLHEVSRCGWVEVKKQSTFVLSTWKAREVVVCGPIMVLCQSSADGDNPVSAATVKKQAIVLKDAKVEILVGGESQRPFCFRVLSHMWTKNGTTLYTPQITAERRQEFTIAVPSEQELQHWVAFLNEKIFEAKSMTDIDKDALIPFTRSHAQSVIHNPRQSLFTATTGCSEETSNRHSSACSTEDERSVEELQATRNAPRRKASVTFMNLATGESTANVANRDRATSYPEPNTPAAAEQLQPHSPVADVDPRNERAPLPFRRRTVTRSPLGASSIPTGEMKEHEEDDAFAADESEVSTADEAPKGATQLPSMNTRLVNLVKSSMMRIRSASHTCLVCWIALVFALLAAAAIGHLQLSVAWSFCAYGLWLCVLWNINGSVIPQPGHCVGIAVSALAHASGQLTSRLPLLGLVFVSSCLYMSLVVPNTKLDNHSRKKELSEVQMLVKAMTELPDWADESSEMNRPTNLVWKFEWLNVALYHMWKHSLCKAIGDTCLDCLNPLLAQSLPSFLKELELTIFDLGPQPPQILNVRIDRAIETAVVLDIEIRGELDTDLTLRVKPSTGPQGKIRLNSLSIHGVLRLEFDPLVELWPTFSALSYSFTEMPTITFKMDAFKLQVMSVPYISGFIESTITRLISRFFVLPAKVTAPDWRSIHEKELQEKVRIPMGVLFVELLSARVSDHVSSNKYSCSLKIEGYEAPCSQEDTAGETPIDNDSSGRSQEALSKVVAGPHPQWDEQFLLNVPNSFTNRLCLQIRRTGGLITSGIEVGSADITILDLEGSSSEKQTLHCSNGRAEIDVAVRWAPFKVRSSNVSAELRQPGDSDSTSKPQSEDSSLNRFTRQLSQKRSFSPTSHSFEGMVYMVVHRSVTEAFCPTPISVTAFVQGSHSMKSTQGQQMRPRHEGFEAFFQDETLALLIQNSQETQICFQLVNKVGSEQGKLGYAMLSFAEVLQRESQREYSGQATTGAVAHHLWEIPLLPDGTLHVSMYWNTFE